MTELLSRIQFAFTITFHILFPAFSIGLATFLAIMEGLWLKTKNPLYYHICRYWIKVFALTFGMGVVSGIVMEFQLGTNWAGFTSAVGPVLGGLFTYEVLTAFFIEAGFLGVMIFGWNKVGPKLHYVATLLVAFGVTLSAFWILSANSWMQTPAGAALQQHHFVVSSWWHVIFNHSTIVRFLHMLLAAYLCTAFVITSIAAYYLLQKRHIDFSKTCLRFGLAVIIISIPFQIWLGDEAGLKDHQYQPIKTAAMEANWQTQRGAPFVIFAIPDQQEQKNLFAVEIPHMASLINTHQWNGKLQGLDSVPAADQPFVPIVFYSFRIMVGLGMLMLLIGILGQFYRIRGSLYEKTWFLKVLWFSAPIGFIAMITGWFTAETGRQPWIVYGLLRTSDAVSKVHVRDVIISFALLFLVYGIIFGVFYFRYLRRVIRKGPVIEQDDRMPFSYMQPQNKEQH